MKSLSYRYIIVILFFSSCTVNKLARFNYNNGPNPWINAFKDRVFVKCLEHSYNNDSIFTMINKIDVYVNPYDAFYLEGDRIKLLDSLSHSIPLHIPPPSGLIEGVDGRNFYLCNCLHYYASKELDSIARKEYKNELKITKKSGLH